MPFTLTRQEIETMRQAAAMDDTAPDDAPPGAAAAANGVDDPQPFFRVEFRGRDRRAPDRYDAVESLDGFSGSGTFINGTGALQYVLFFVLCGNGVLHGFQSLLGAVNHTARGCLSLLFEDTVKVHNYTSDSHSLSTPGTFT